jgi:hypothetical protein
MSRLALRLVGTLALCALAASTALAGEGEATDATDPASPDDAPTAAMTPADLEPLVDRLVSCAQAEGTDVSAEDRGTLRDLGSLLAGKLGGALDAGPCNDAACVGTLATTDCTTLGLALASGSFALGPTGPTPPWAKAWADAIGAKILACWAEEQGGAAPSADDVARVGAFTAALGAGVGAQTAGGGCTVNEGALDGCLAAIRAKGCAEMAAYLDTESDGASFVAACGGLIDCGAGLPSE